MITYKGEKRLRDNERNKVEQTTRRDSLSSKRGLSLKKRKNVETQCKTGVKKQKWPGKTQEKAYIWGFKKRGEKA